jgi:hypothetical protein
MSVYSQRGKTEKERQSVPERRCLEKAQRRVRREKWAKKNMEEE